MKKYILLVLLVFSTSLFSYLCIKLIRVHFYGIEVDRELNTGPDFLVIKGEEILREMYNNNDSLDYSAFYFTSDYDSILSFPTTPRHLIIIGENHGVSTRWREPIPFPLIQITEFYDVEIEYFFIRMFTVIMGLITMMLVFFNIRHQKRRRLASPVEPNLTK